MAKITFLECPDCCNSSTISTKSKEPTQYCPLCGVLVILAESADEDDDYEEEDDED